jgi:hypothetical protein
MKTRGRVCLPEDRVWLSAGGVNIVSGGTEPAVVLSGLVQATT